MSVQPDDTLNRDKIYQKLPLVGEQIRLLTIRPGRKDDPLRCDLSLADWDHLLDYEALSYAWGSFTDRRKIRLNDRIIFVTRNLRNALSAFRYLDKPRILWVDALCINQNSMLEKNHQIRLMDQIYSKTSLVKIWLGEENEPGDSENEPVFLRDLLRPDSSGNFPPVFLEVKRRRDTNERVKHYRAATSTAEEDDPSQRIGYQNPNLEDRSREKDKFLPRPFVFNLDPNVTEAINKQRILLNEHGACIANDTWVRDGSRNDNTAIMFIFLQTMARNEHVTSMPWLQDFCYRRNILKVASAMIRRPWWNRTWTIQEIGLAQKADVVLGGLVAPWSLITTAAANILKHRSSCCVNAFSEMDVYEVDVFLEFCRKVLDIEGIRRLCRNEQLLSKLDPHVLGHVIPPTLPIHQTLQLLWYTRSRFAWDARDKIFGLLGAMKTWSDVLPVEPDYSTATHVVFRQLTTTLINQTKGYDILMGNLGKFAYPELPDWMSKLDLLPNDLPSFLSPGKDQHPHEHPELVQLKGLAAYNPSYIDKLPSWVPDLAAPASTFEKERVQRASLFCASSASNAPAARVLADAALEVHTLPVDKIKNVGPVMMVAKESSLNPILMQWLFLTVRDAAERGYDMSSYWDQDYLNGGSMSCAWHRTISMDSIPTTQAEPGQSTQYRRSDDHADPITFLHWLAPLMNAKDDSNPVDLGTVDKNSTSAVSSEMALLGASVKSATFLRCFFITERGYFGLGPSKTCPGDEVKVFLGGRVPFVVRRVAPAAGAPAEACYSLVGDCFLQGIMDGERVVQAVAASEESSRCYLV